MDFGNSTMFRKKDNNDPPFALKESVGVKFATKILFTNPYWVVGGTLWSRFIYRMKNFPLMAIRLAFRSVYLKIRRLFVKDRPVPIEAHDWIEVK